MFRLQIIDCYLLDYNGYVVLSEDPKEVMCRIFVLLLYDKMDLKRFTFKVLCDKYWIQYNTIL